MHPRTARGNRYGLALIGGLLIAGGTYALLRSRGSLGQRQRSSDPLLTDAEARWAGDHPWFWIAVAATCILIVLLMLRWLLVQLRVERLRRLHLEPDATLGGTQMPAGALTDAVENDIGAYPGVHAAHARLTGDPDHPELHLRVVIDPRTDLGGIRRRIRDEAIIRARTALELDQLPVSVALAVDRRSRGSRVR